MVLRGKTSQSALAREIGVSPQSIQYLLDPRNNASGSKHSSSLAVALRVHPDWLARGVGPMDDDTPEIQPAFLPGFHRVPLISTIQAGAWSEIVDNFQPGDADEWLAVDRPLSPGAFALDIRGRSMEPEFFAPDRVIIDPAVVPRPGDFVAAKNGDQEATFKKYRPRGLDDNGHMVFELVPLNPDFPVLRSDLEPITIIGTMMEHRRYRKTR